MIIVSYIVKTRKKDSPLLWRRLFSLNPDFPFNFPEGKQGGGGSGGQGSGILKKPGPYGMPMDGNTLEKEKWLEENAERLSRLDRMDRMSTSSQNQLAGPGR